MFHPLEGCKDFLVAEQPATLQCPARHSPVMQNCDYRSYVRTQCSAGQQWAHAQTSCRFDVLTGAVSTLLAV